MTKSFIAENLILIIALGSLIVAYGIFEVFMSKASEIAEISAQKTVDLFNHQQALLLDIRPLTDFNTAHCLGAVSVHHYDAARLEQFKDKPIVVICNSGRTSVTYAKELAAKGFAQALSLAGGIIGWKNADFPLAI